MTESRDVETVHWDEWFGELEHRVTGDMEVWVIPDAELLASSPPDADYSVLPPFLADWLRTVDEEEDPEGPAAGWRRCAAFLLKDAGITVVPPEQLLHESRTLSNPQWVSQPPTREWVAYGFTDELAIVWRWKDWEKYPVGFASRRTLDVGFAELIDESDDVAGEDYEECITCDECEEPWSIYDEDNLPSAVFSSAREDDEDAQRKLCGNCRKEFARQCEYCTRRLLPLNPTDGSSNFREIDGEEYCLSCADETAAEA